MNSKLKLFILLFSFVIFLYIYQGCDGIFPTQSKPNVPPDHNVNYGGYLHIGEREGGNEVDDCNDCHGNDLRGQVYNYNGHLVITPSCYQCHGAVWEREGGGGEN